MQTAVKKRNLDVQTKMTDTIFLEPVAPNKKIIFIDMKNTSDKEVAVKDNLRKSLIEKGYVITQDPTQATYMIQGNILKVSKADKREIDSYARGGYNSAISGAAIGVAAGYALGGDSQDVALAGLAVGALGLLGDAMVEDTYYVMVTDLQIRERPLDGERITQTQKAKLAQGSATNVTQKIQGGRSSWKTYRTRIVSTAEQVNLDFDEAKPELQKALVRSVSGIF